MGSAMKKYEPKKIEKKWQTYWAKNKTFEVKEDKHPENKFYSLIEFPYPSGEGLHVGHPRPFTAMDVISRKKRMEGKNVLFPIGFDAFGLPTENFAIKTGKPPAEVTKKNIANFTRQLKMLGFSFDWSRQVDTTDPNYYKWTQKIFLQFFKHGLAYKKNQPINWCPKDKIGLANEEVVNGCCERCGTPVEKRNKEQWMLAITKYADKLLQGLKNVDYIERARVQQENWIGKSEGAEVVFPLRMVPGQTDDKHSVKVFTTRPDTIFGVTFLAISAELAQKWLDVGWQASEGVKNYVHEVLQHKANISSREEQEKTGVNAGIMAINPVSKKEIPVWVTNYVMGEVGTGAIMGVPAHDERDFDFAKKFGLPVVEVVSGAAESGQAFFGEGVATNSDFLNGLKTPEAKEKMINWLEENKIGKKQINYKLRDWVFSRQRYWGEPIPLVHCQNCEDKKYNIVLLHGFEGSSKTNFFPWLKQTLEEHGHKVFAPELPNSQNANVEEQIKFVLDNFTFDENTILLGHSLGGVVAMKVLERIKNKIHQLVLIDSFVSPGPDRAYASTTTWEFDYKKIRSHAEEISMLVDSTHSVVSADRQVGMRENLQAAIITRIPVRDHFCAEREPEVLQMFEQSGWVPLPESKLPLKLPKVEKYQPTDTGESPLAAMEKWVKTKCPNCGGAARRETDTMPNWAGSSWYFLAYALGGEKRLKEKGDKFWNQEMLKHWQPVDWYNGGMEHTVLHLLYSRFWNQFLYDIGMVPTPEPYAKRTSHGMILAKGGEKMSKSRGNVVNPDEMVEQFGADALRAYIMFMGPFDQAVEWDTNGLVGVKRFLDKVYIRVTGLEASRVVPNELENANFNKSVRLLHQTIKKVSEDIESMRFNTAISQLMIFVNEAFGTEKDRKQIWRPFVKLLSPFAPHLAEELWQMLNKEEGKTNNSSIAYEPWPKFNPELIKETEVTLAVQVNGKLRDTLVVPADISEEEAKKLALQSENVKKWLEGKEPKKIIYVKGKLISVVV